MSHATVINFHVNQSRQSEASIQAKAREQVGGRADGAHRVVGLCNAELPTHDQSHLALFLRYLFSPRCGMYRCGRSYHIHLSRSCALICLKATHSYIKLLILLC